MWRGVLRHDLAVEEETIPLGLSLLDQPRRPGGGRG